MVESSSSRGATIERAVNFLNTYGTTAVTTAVPTVDLAKGTEAYKAEDLPTPCGRNGWRREYRYRSQSLDH